MIHFFYGTLTCPSSPAPCPSPSSVILSLLFLCDLVYSYGLHCCSEVDESPMVPPSYTLDHHVPILSSHWHLKIDSYKTNGFGFRPTYTTACCFLQLRINGKLRIQCNTPRSAFHHFLHIQVGRISCLPRKVSWKVTASCSSPLSPPHLSSRPFGSFFYIPVDSICSSVSFLPMGHHQLSSRTRWCLFK